MQPIPPTTLPTIQTMIQLLNTPTGWRGDRVSNKEQGKTSDEIDVDTSQSPT